MIWIYFLAYIFTIGIALNSQKDENNLLKTGTIEIEEQLKIKICTRVLFSTYFYFFNINLVFFTNNIEE